VIAALTNGPQYNVAVALIYRGAVSSSLPPSPQLSALRRTNGHSYAMPVESRVVVVGLYIRWVLGDSIACA